MKNHTISPKWKPPNVLDQYHPNLNAHGEITGVHAACVQIVESYTKPNSNYLSRAENIVVMMDKQIELIT